MPSHPGQGHTAWVDGNPQETGMTTAFPPNKARHQPDQPRRPRHPDVLISKNQPLYGAITARSYHPGGVNALFGDGSVRFIKSTIDGNTWRAPRHDRRRRGHQRRFLLERLTRALRPPDPPCPPS